MEILLSTIYKRAVNHQTEIRNETIACPFTGLREHGKKGFH